MTIGGSDTHSRASSESKCSSCAAPSPPPTSASAVRFQARYVRSLASVKRGSISSPGAIREQPKTFPPRAPAAGILGPLKTAKPTRERHEERFAPPASAAPEHAVLAL